MQLDQIMQLESQKFMFVFDQNGASGFNNPSPAPMGYGQTDYSVQTHIVAETLLNVAPNMSRSTIERLREPLYVPPEIPTYDLMRHVESLQTPSVSHYEPMAPFRNVQDDYKSLRNDDVFKEARFNYEPPVYHAPEIKPLFNGSVERLTRHFPSQIGYKLNDDLDYHTHGRSEDDLSYGHFKYQGLHVPGSDRNGFEASMDADRFERAGYNKYNMGKNRSRYDEDYTPPMPEIEPFKPIEMPTFDFQKRNRHDDDDDFGRGGSPATIHISAYTPPPIIPITRPTMSLFGNNDDDDGLIPLYKPYIKPYIASQIVIDGSSSFRFGKQKYNAMTGFYEDTY